MLVTIKGCVYRIRIRKPNRRQEAGHWHSLPLVCEWYWFHRLYSILFCLMIILKVTNAFFHNCIFSSETCRKYDDWSILYSKSINVSRLDFLKGYFFRGLDSRENLRLYLHPLEKELCKTIYKKILEFNSEKCLSIVYNSLLLKSLK